MALCLLRNQLCDVWADLLSSTGVGNFEISRAVVFARQEPCSLRRRFVVGLFFVALLFSNVSGTFASASLLLCMLWLPLTSCLTFYSGTPLKPSAGCRMPTQPARSSFAQQPRVSACLQMSEGSSEDGDMSVSGARAPFSTGWKFAKIGRDRLESTAPRMRFGRCCRLLPPRTDRSQRTARQSACSVIF